MRIFTDGSCRGNGKEKSVGGFGVVVLDEKDNIVEYYSKQEENTTNNRMEMKAIIYALYKYGKIKDAIVYSDSSYCVNTFTKWIYTWEKNGWIKSDKKEPENLDLIKAYRFLEARGYKIRIEKVKGHNGILGNELADKLATNSFRGEKGE